jgi:hypothetical protein
MITAVRPLASVRASSAPPTATSPRARRGCRWRDAARGRRRTSPDAPTSRVQPRGRGIASTLRRSWVSPRSRRDRLADVGAGVASRRRHSPRATVLVPEHEFSSLVLPFVHAGRGIRVRTAPLSRLADAISSERPRRVLARAVGVRGRRPRRDLHRGRRGRRAHRAMRRRPWAGCRSTPRASTPCSATPTSGCAARAASPSCR